MEELKGRTKLKVHLKKEKRKQKRLSFSVTETYEEIYSLSSDEVNPVCSTIL